MTSRKFRILLVLIVLFITGFLINVSLGSVRISLDEVLIIILGGEPSKATWKEIVLNFRIPKALTASLVGAGLGISGLLMQTLFRNPLAGPFVLGISSGASLGVALLVLGGFALGKTISYLGLLGGGLLVLASGVGAFLVLFLVLLVSIRIKDSMTLLIIGLMFGSATGALVSVLQFFSKSQDIQAYLIWTFGSLGNISYQEMVLFVPLVVAGIILGFVLSKHLNALLIGENYAVSMGLDHARVRLWIILATSLLAGTITSFCGPIAFVGIAIPHLARITINSSNHQVLIPAVCFLGAAVMLICDTIAQIPGSQFTLPINAITSLFGAPIVIWIILKKRDVRSSFAG